MATFTAADRSWDVGVPAQESHDFGVTPTGLITGEYPTQFVEDLPAALNQTLAAYTVVKLNADGDVVPATADEPAIGITYYPVTSPAAGAKPGVRVLRSACINPFYASLVWDASFTTRESKMNAFQGAPSPTQIVTRPLSHGTPVTP